MFCCCIEIFFLDVNECNAGFDSCHINAKCINTDGSYDCDCEQGFTGDGFNCSSKFFSYLKDYFLHHLLIGKQSEQADFSEVEYTSSNAKDSLQ